jgi:hypothetical protein
LLYKYSCGTALWPIAVVELDVDVDEEVEVGEEEGLLDIVVVVALVESFI